MDKKLIAPGFEPGKANSRARAHVEGPMTWDDQTIISIIYGNFQGCPLL